MDPVKGLSQHEAEELHLRFGPNEMVRGDWRSHFLELQRILLDPMGLMLLGLAALYRIMGELTDSAMLLAAYFPIIAVDVVLELRASRALRVLSGSLQSHAKVLRDGKVMSVPIRKIVPGDWLVFEEGQTLPADGTILESHLLCVSEAALTGESMPVNKSAGSDFFAGTSILQGRGLGVVDRIGRETRFGGIARLMEDAPRVETPLQRVVRALVRRILWVAGVFSILLFCVLWIRGSAPLQGLIESLTFAMSAVPEEFPLVFTLYLSLGAHRLARHGILVKSLPAVETLGRVDVICTDKTGTLTEGRFQLEKIVPYGDSGSIARDGGGRGEPPSVALEQMSLIARLACEVDPVDAMEHAILEHTALSTPVPEEWILQFDHPFETSGKHMSHVWRRTRDGTQVIAMKGAVEGVLDHCVPASMRADILKQSELLSLQGNRLLGLASREGVFEGVRERDEEGLRFLGFLVFSDPIRPSARRAIEECRRAGIRIKVLTGDHPFTARAVANALGLGHAPNEVHTGSQLVGMSGEERASAYREGVIFARVLPEQKHEMVMALQKNGSVVAMMGDGVNDAPALKLADIGISMGSGATDVARASAGMVLLKNDFAGVVHAVFEGRRVFANLKRSFSYLISFHVPVVVLALFPPLLGWGQFLLPVHIVLLELIVHPISAFSFENLGTPDGAGRPSGWMGRRELLEAVGSGLLLSFGALWVYKTRLVPGTDVARAVGMLVLFFGNMFLVLLESGVILELGSKRGFDRNLWIRPLLTVAALLGLCGAVFLIPQLRERFHLDPLSGVDAGLGFLMGAGALVPAFIHRVHRLIKRNSKRD
jgi:Ca2+-transporting ATPase